MSLPLLERAQSGDPIARFTDLAPSLIPARAPRPGEQYRFHFDMTKCIGCKCCEVACAEQNGSPVEISWRRVGEIEGGQFPYTERFNLSMGCNHCLDAACLKGCPVDAYTKDALTGIVLHSADACIGCGYCTWNCPYGVPQFNEERGVVGKCDMCYHRLADGRDPACVNACPEGAIQIETVNIAEWRENFTATANAPGIPSAEHTISTTRITLPPALSEDFRKADYHRVRPEHPHWPLVFMLTLTQLAAGAFLLLSGTQRVEGSLALLITAIALGASTLHLGRPIHAYRALRMWRRSWLSREVLLLTLFFHAAMLTVAALWLRPAFVPLATLLTGILGFAGITASACIYLVPARPAWNTAHTLPGFYLTALLLGALFTGHEMLGMIAALAQLMNQSALWLRLRQSEEFEKFAAARLFREDCGWLFTLRLLGLPLAAALAVAGHDWAAFAAALGAEFIGRYLFFVTVVPRNMALTYLAREAA